MGRVRHLADVRLGRACDGTARGQQVDSSYCELYRTGEFEIRADRSARVTKLPIAMEPPRQRCRGGFVFYPSLKRYAQKFFQEKAAQRLLFVDRYGRRDE